MMLLHYSKRYWPIQIGRRGKKKSKVTNVAECQNNDVRIGSVSGTRALLVQDSDCKIN